MKPLIDLNFKLADIFSRKKSKKSDLRGLLNMDQKTYLSKTKGLKTERFYDTDRDGVINGLDCFPFDKNRHKPVALFGEGKVTPENIRMPNPSFAPSQVNIPSYGPSQDVYMQALHGSRGIPSTSGFQAINGKQQMISIPRQNLRAFDGMAQPPLPPPQQQMRNMPMQINPRQMLREQPPRKVMRGDGSGQANISPTGGD